MLPVLGISNLSYNMDVFHWSAHVVATNTSYAGERLTSAELASV